MWLSHGGHVVVTWWSCDCYIVVRWSKHVHVHVTASGFFTNVHAISIDVLLTSPLPPPPDYCMVNFVKPNLLGTMKEFRNRFVNPIINGQHRDSMPEDVRLMRHRAHILHHNLSGCVDVRRGKGSLVCVA